MRYKGVIKISHNGCNFIDLKLYASHVAVMSFLSVYVSDLKRSFRQYIISDLYLISYLTDSFQRVLHDDMTSSVHQHSIIFEKMEFWNRKGTEWTLVSQRISSWKSSDVWSFIIWNSFYYISNSRKTDCRSKREMFTIYF